MTDYPGIGNRRGREVDFACQARRPRAGRKPVIDVTDTLGPELFDPESRLPGPAALLRAVSMDFAWARKHDTPIGIAVLYIPEPKIDAIRAAIEVLKSQRKPQDVVARISSTLFAVAIGTRYDGRPSYTIPIVLDMLAAAAMAVSEAGGGDARGRVFWLHPRHQSAEELYQEAAGWQPDGSRVLRREELLCCPQKAPTWL